MYHIVATFHVPPERHDEFIAAALEDARNSRTSESGTKRLELVKDRQIPNRFYLDEVYDDEAAFDRHKEGPNFKRFFDIVGEFAEERSAINGHAIHETVRAAPGLLKVFEILEHSCKAYEQLSRPDTHGKFEPEHPKNFCGTVRASDLAAQAGLTGIEILAVFFEPDARTKPHAHPTEQLLYFVHANGFVGFPGQEEQVFDEGSVVVVPACELHMHGATAAGPTCHVAARLPGKTNWNPRVPAEWRQFTEDR